MKNVVLSIVLSHQLPSVGLRKPRTIITGIIITGTMVDTPSRATGTIIALVGRGEVPTWSQLVKQLGSVLLLSLTPDRWRFRILCLR
jgi:hypothetical protein